MGRTIKSFTDLLSLPATKAVKFTRTLKSQHILG